MVELIPIDSDMFIGSATEFTVVFNRFGIPRKVFLWVGDRAIDIASLLDRNYTLIFDNYRVSLWQWFEQGIPTPYRFFRDIDSYIDTIISWGLEKIRSEKVLVSFSGGKDSTVSLIASLKLVDRLGIDVKPIYIHMPYLEPLENVSIAIDIAKKLGIELEVREPKKRIVREYLYREGLPFRGNRWCTYLKTRPMRDFCKSMGIRYNVVGDRIWETVKRFRRLALKVLNRRLVKKRDIYLVAPLTIIDIASIIRPFSTVHRHYLLGASRVACIFCPYKSAYELRLDLGRVEDPGLIDSILRIEWRKWYRDHIDLESFVSEHLWRYKPRVAEIFLKLKNYIEKKAIELGLEEIKVNTIANMYRKIWTSDLSTYPIEDIDKVIRSLLKIYVEI